MAKDTNKESSVYPIIVTADEAWEIINNQINVQEQLRTKGQQTLQIVATVAVIIAGISITFDYSVPNAEIENVANDMPVSALDLSGTLLWNAFIIFFLSIIIIGLLVSFISRNYIASQHSSLQPGLGERRNHPVFVVRNNGHRELISEKSTSMQQFTRWIESNNHEISEKRQQLSKANTSLSLSLSALFIAGVLFMSILQVDIFPLLYFDAILFVLALFSVYVILKTRNERFLVRNSWPLTEQQIEDIPYLNTPEMGLIVLCYIPISVLTFYVLQHYIQAYIPIILEHITSVMLVYSQEIIL